MSFEELEFERLFAEIARRPNPGRWAPNTDVFVDEEAGCVVVKVEVAGAEAERLRVGVDKRHLVIIGRRTDAARFSRGSFLQKEIEYGEFCKKIHLPVPVAYQRASATYQDGFLTIRLPVAPEVTEPMDRAEVRMIVKRILV